MIYYFDKNREVCFFDLLLQIFLPINFSGPRYLPSIRLCEGNFIILEIVMVICKFTIRHEKSLLGGGREKNIWNRTIRWTKQIKVCGHFTTKCLSTASQAQHGGLGLIQLIPRNKKHLMSFYLYFWSGKMLLFHNWSIMVNCRFSFSISVPSYTVQFNFVLCTGGEVWYVSKIVDLADMFVKLSSIFT